MHTVESDSIVKTVTPKKCYDIWCISKTLCKAKKPKTKDYLLGFSLNEMSRKGKSLEMISDCLKLASRSRN